MVFRVTLVSKDTSVPAIILLNDVTSFIGREKRFGINDRRISRKHIEVIPSSYTKSVILHQLSGNPSVIIRKNEQPATLQKDDVFQLQEGDVISLLNGRYVFTVNIEDDENKEMEDGYSEELTQVDIEGIEEAERRKKRKTPDEEETGENNKRAKLDRNTIPANSNVLINPHELLLKRTIGVGSCGEVTECSWRGTKVAVKRIFRTLLHGDALSEFYQESEIMRRLRHPNIVLFMGTCVQSRDLCIVTEYMEKGSLKDVLYNPAEQLDWNLRLRMAADAAKGMNYLHTYSPPVIHRDLKSHNLLVDQNYTVKVTDFGLAKFNPSDDKNKTFCGTLPWTAPEVFSGKGYSGKADIYSYGIVLWEIAARTEPYAGVDKPKLIMGVTTERMRPPIPMDCPPGFAELIKDCWGEDPELRPLFVEILKRIETFISQTSSPTSNSNSNSNPPLVHSGKLEIGTSSTPNPTPMTLTTQFQETVAQKTLHFTWAIDPKDLEFLGDLGEGASATVYRGKYKGKTVAIKVLKESLDGKHRDDFYKELEVISSVKSSHVVEFYGACTEPQFTIVTEFLSNGSLYQIMTKSELTLDWEVTIKLALESAKAINALHKWEPSIIHRDLKPQNLLVDSDWTVKIADFGLARFFNTNNQSLSKLRGSYAYAAPEPYRGLPVTTKSDVFSFGIVLWELVTRCITKAYQKPYSEHTNLKFDFQIIIQSNKGVRPTINAQTPLPFKDLIQKCWDMDPEKRPSMESVISQLSSISDLFQQEKSRNV